MKKVVLVDPKSRIIENKETLLRHEHYGQELKKLDKEYTLVCISKINPDCKKAIKNLDFVSTKHKIFILSLLQYLKKHRKEVKCVVFGDPWFYTLLILIFLFVFVRNLNVQIQFHADIEEIPNKTKSIIKNLRWRIARLSIKFTSNIRFVSKIQKEKFENKFKVKLVNAIIAPIPITWNLDLEPSGFGSKSNKLSSPLKMGFLGRFHKERNLKELYYFFKLLPEEALFELHIAGQGKEKNKFLQKFEILKNINVIDYGFITKENFKLFFQELDIFLNLTQNESYGRSMREALIYKTPVLAMESSGALDLRSIVLDKDLIIINKNTTKSELEIKINKLRKNRIKTNYFDIFRKIDEKSIKMLVHSWIGK